MSDYHTRTAVREMQKIEQARAVVRPYVGELPAMDSAAGVYLAALKAMGKPAARLRGLEHGDAAAEAFDIASGRAARVSLAMDSAGAEERRARMFPNADRFR